MPVVLSKGPSLLDVSAYPVRLVVEQLAPCAWETSSSIAIEEMTSHGHTAVCSSAGEHTHGIFTGNNTNAPYNMVSTQARDFNTTRYTDSSGNHVHTISISSNGGNQRHENRMPYQVINRWKRTA